jgi:integrase
MASLIIRNDNHYAQFYDAMRSPQRKRIALKTTKKSVARRLLGRLEDAYALGEYDPWTQDLDALFDRRRDPVTIQETLDKFLSRKRQAGRSENTLNSYRWIVGLFAKRVCPDVPLARVSARDIETFIRDGSVAPSTRRARFRHVRAFLNWAKKKGYIQTAPTEAVEAPEKPQKLPQRLTQDDLKAICTALRADYRAKREAGQCSDGQLIWYAPLFRFAFFTGMRVSELARLRWSDIDVSRDLIYIRRQKSGREQTIPLSPKAAEALDGLSRGGRDAFVFTSPSFDKTSRSTRRFCERASMVFRRAREAAGLPDQLTFHSLRHGFCTALAEAGKSAVVIKEAARHADIQTSMRYVHMANETLKSELGDVFQ